MVIGPAHWRSNRLRHHLDRAAGTLGHADTAAFAVVEVELEPLPRSELDHGVIRTHTVTVVALEAIAARQAAARLEQCIGLVQTVHNLVERGSAPREIEHRSHRL